MDVITALQGVYRPINAYQTRIIRLHGDNGAPSSPLRCSLHTADILHPKFEGLGVRSPSNEDDSIVEYDGLSYTWGDNVSSQVITCNDVEFPITDNLFEALRALRRSQDHARYLWVDAICINQSDLKERSEQVWNMLMIYQKATRVIAWLGTEAAIQRNIEDVLLVASSISLSPSPENVLDFWRIYEGIFYVYTRPWFRRIWVQQEIFAARKLRMQFGDFRFEWPELLSKPNLLLNIPQIQPYIQSGLDEKKDKKKSRETIPMHVTAQIDAVSKLDRIYTRHLNCFEQFSTPEPRSQDFIHTLLSTGSLGASNPKDYIYGIIGITGIPSKAMPIQQWLTARQHEVFIPIDYSADLTSILCTVSWAVLMWGGFGILAKFKVFSAGGESLPDRPLPSWVVDWRLTARLFDTESLSVNENATIPEMQMGRVVWSDEPAEQQKGPQDQVYEDNNDGTSLYTELIVRGMVDPRFYAKGKYVWQKRQLRKDKAVWHFEFDVYPTDLVVRTSAFVNTWYDHDFGRDRRFDRRPGGLCLLRDAGNDKFKLIACLSWFSDQIPRGYWSNYQPLYHNWTWNPEYFRQTFPQEEQVGTCRRLFTAPDTATDRDEMEDMYGDQKFTII